MKTMPFCVLFSPSVPTTIELVEALKADRVRQLEVKQGDAARIAQLKKKKEEEEARSNAFKVCMVCNSEDVSYNATRMIAYCEKCGHVVNNVAYTAKAKDELVRRRAGTAGAGAGIVSN